MLRRKARERREYLYRKEVEAKHRAVQDKKERVRNALASNRLLDTDVKRDALELAKAGQWDDAGPEQAIAQGGAGGGTLANSQDDEYRWAGVEDPKIMITTSRDPSSKLKQFAKELRLIFPGAQRLNRGTYEFKQLMEACRANAVTDFLVVHEHRGVPDGLVVCHLPHGPTAYFTMTDIVMRHDIPDIGKVSEAAPHLVFHNFKTRLGERCMNILKYLFPVPKEDSKRVITFANHDDFISFRHHNFKKVDGGKDIELKEVGPRFQLRLYQIKLGTLEMENSADTEWVLRPYMNTAKKKTTLSDVDGWEVDT